MVMFKKGDLVIFTCPANGREYVAEVAYAYRDGDVSLQGPGADAYCRDVGLTAYYSTTPGGVIVNSAHLSRYVAPDTLAKIQALFEYTAGEQGARLSFHDDRLVAWRTSPGDSTIYGKGSTLVEMIDKAYSALRGISK